MDCLDGVPDADITPRDYTIPKDCHAYERSKLVQMDDPLPRDLGRSIGLGLALVAAGLVVGFGSTLTELLADPLNPGTAIEQANPTVTLLFAVLGIIVWQLGKTYALFVTLPRAAGRAAGRQLDATQLASEVHNSLDDRLASLEVELEETRRAVRDLEDDAEIATFDERDHVDADETPAIESGSSEPASLPSSSSTHTAQDESDDTTGKAEENGENDEMSDGTADTDGDRDPIA